MQCCSARERSIRAHAAVQRNEHRRQREGGALQEATARCKQLSCSQHLKCVSAANTQTSSVTRAASLHHGVSVHAADVAKSVAQVVLALGSNLGDRAAVMEKAVRRASFSSRFCLPVRQCPHGGASRFILFLLTLCSGARTPH